MSHVTLRLRLEMDGRMMDGYPVVAGLSVVATHNFRLPQAPEDTIYEPLPTESLFGNIQLLVLRPDGPVKLRVGGQTTSNIPLAGRGVILLFAGSMDKVAQIRDDADTHVDAVAGG